MDRARGLVSAVILAAVGASCSVVSGLDEFELTSGAASSGGAGGAASSTSSGGGEICLNGSDDDGDGDADCADTDCADLECIQPPAGWEGPGILYAGPADARPDCPSDFPDVVFDGYRSPVQPGTACTECQCSPAAVVCDPSAVVAYDVSSCSGSASAFDQPTMDNICASLPVDTSVDAYKVPAPTVMASLCTPSGGALPSLAVGRVCSAAAGGGCESGEVCVPRSVAPPFEGRICIWRAGDEVCPLDYPDLHLFASTVEDTRACASCGCGNPLASCAVTTTIYSDINCTTPIASIPNDNSCVIAMAAQAMMLTMTTNAQCQPSGGQLTGTVTEGPDRTTVCCKP